MREGGGEGPPLLPLASPFRLGHTHVGHTCVCVTVSEVGTSAGLGSDSVSTSKPRLVCNPEGCHTSRLLASFS